MSVVVFVAFVGDSRPASADVTVEKLTGNAITGVGPYVQDVSDAIRQFAAKNYPAALEHLESAKKSTPRLAPPEVMMAQLHYDAAQPGAAVAMLERAIARVPQDPESYVLLAERAMAEGRLTEAEMLFYQAGKALEIFTDNPRRKQDLQVRTFAGAASVDETRANFKEARGKLESLVKLDPRNAQGHDRLGRVLFALEDQKAAYAEFKLAAEIDKNAVPAELAMANLFPDKPSAEKWLNFAINKSKEDLRTRLAAANYLLRSNQAEAAKVHADEALKMDPNGFDSNSVAGLIARMMGDYKKSEAYLAKAHLLAPTHPGVINHLALVLLELPNNEGRERALQYAELGAKLNPTSMDALTTLGWINYRLNRRREAERAFTVAMASPDGTTRPTMTSDMAYYLAHLAKEQGNIPEAINLLKDALNTELPFAYRKAAGDFLAELSKLDKSAPKPKDERAPATSKNVEPQSKSGAAK